MTAERDAGTATVDETEPDAPETGPTRRCVVSGEVRPRAELVRFVVAPDGTVVPDVAARLPGRGLWVAAARTLVDKARAKGAFARAARRPVTVPADLADRTHALLVRRFLDRVGLARRAGALAIGFDQVDGALRRGRVGLVIHAADAGADGRQKLASLAPHVPSVAPVPGAALARALGRDGVTVYLGVAPGPFIEQLLTDAGRVTGLAPPPGPGPGGSIKAAE